MEIDFYIDINYTNIKVIFTPLTCTYVGGVFLLKLLFNSMIEKAINNDASDIHFIPADKEVMIKFRIRDDLKSIETL